MGMYQDIQDDIKEAMLDDLADAVATLVITEEVSSTAYDVATGTVSSLPNTYTMDCIIVKDKEEKKDMQDTSTDFFKFLVLDSYKTVPEFKPGMKATVRNTDYEIGMVDIDPVGATHVIKCRKI